MTQPRLRAMTGSCPRGRLRTRQDVASAGRGRAQGAPPHPPTVRQNADTTILKRGRGPRPLRRPMSAPNPIPLFFALQLLIVGPVAGYAVAAGDDYVDYYTECATKGPVEQCLIGCSPAEPVADCLARILQDRVSALTELVSRRADELRRFVDDNVQPEPAVRALAGALAPFVPMAADLVCAVVRGLDAFSATVVCGLGVRPGAALVVEVLTCFAERGVPGLLAVCT